MFRTSQFHPQRDSCICSMVCFTFILSTRLLTQMHINIPCCVYSSLPEDEPKRLENCRRQQELSNLENCTFRWFVLYHFITNPFQSTEHWKCLYAGKWCTCCFLSGKKKRQKKKGKLKGWERNGKERKGVVLRCGIPALLVEFVMKEIWPVNAQLLLW
jgi:hypothetical protein